MVAVETVETAGHREPRCTVPRVSVAQTFAGLVSMEIGPWRLNEEKIFFLAENQTSAPATNHVKY